jgi:hypothetical protein
MSSSIVRVRGNAHPPPNKGPLQRPADEGRVGRSGIKDATYGKKFTKTSSITNTCKFPVFTNAASIYQLPDTGNANIRSQLTQVSNICSTTNKRSRAAVLGTLVR